MNWTPKPGHRAVSGYEKSISFDGVSSCSKMRQIHQKLEIIHSLALITANALLEGGTMSGDMHTIEHFKRLSLQVRRDLATKFGLIDDGDEVGRDMTNIWLLRARDRKKLDDLGKAVQEAPQ